MTGASCIYEGWVRHRRRAPTRHEFTMPLFMVYADLAELPGLFRGSRLWSSRRPAVVWFRRKDYLGDSRLPLDEAVRAEVEGRTGRRPVGPIRVLTLPRQFGVCFNPVTFYYCFDEAGQWVEAVVAEITNTPWKERHRYVLTRGESEAGGVRCVFAKEFHVSPFMPMDVEYDWALRDPGERLLIQMNCRREGGRMFDATLVMERREASAAALRRAMVRFPMLTIAVIARIHFEALRLWLKGTPVIRHPGRVMTVGTGAGAEGSS